jgi:hypothetical protein
MKRRSRKLFKLLLFVLAGAIITLAIAMAATWWQRSEIRDFKVIDIEVRDVNGRPQSAGPVLTEVATNRLTTHIVAWSRVPPGDFPIYGGRKSGRAPWWVPELLWCDASTLDPQLFRSGERVAATTWLAAGWPLRALRCASGNMYTADGKHWIVGGERGMIIASRQGAPPIRIPLEPIWAGFAINTIFYAAIAWGLFAVPGAVRRRLRHKRGQCAACGYSLRESVSDRCPECGNTRGATGRL